MAKGGPNWDGLLKWSLVHSDGTNPHRQLSEDERRWFMEAMQANSVDVIKRMKEITQVMQTLEHVLEEKGVTPEDIEGVAAFEIEYDNWLEEHKRHICELRSDLESQKTDDELRILVETSVSHYFDLFCMKAAAAKTYIFYLMSGMWK